MRGRPSDRQISEARASVSFGVSSDSRRSRPRRSPAISRSAFAGELVSVFLERGFLPATRTRWRLAERWDLGVAIAQSYVLGRPSSMGHYPARGFGMP